jgi:two-component system, NarL family, response regulator DevR
MPDLVASDQRIRCRIGDLPAFPAGIPFAPHISASRGETTVKRIETVEFGEAAGLTADLKDTATQIVSRHSAPPYPIGVRNVANVPDHKNTAEDPRISDFSGCNSRQKEYAILCQAVSRSCEVLPETLPAGTRENSENLFATRGLKAGMALALQVVSSHLIGVLDIERVLSAQPAFATRLCPHANSEADALRAPNFPRLFLLDGCSITAPLGPLSSRLRASSPGSRFLALLAPARNSEAEMIRLFHWGIDGMLVLDEEWKSELPKAIVTLLSNRLWVPGEVLLAFVKVMKSVLDRQLLPGQSLTAREGQVLQLLFRNFTNKEIACGLNISERTAKFHVCNVLNKLGLENRRHFLEAFAQLDRA